jgi:hypothetical protein
MPQFLQLVLTPAGRRRTLRLATPLKAVLVERTPQTPAQGQSRDIATVKSAGIVAQALAIVKAGSGVHACCDISVKPVPVARWKAFLSAANRLPTPAVLLCGMEPSIVLCACCSGLHGCQARC